MVKNNFWHFYLLIISGLACGFISSEIEKGTASYYANSFNGRRTACGETFSNDSLTAAHKSLPFGTIVKVTNIKNDSIILLRINDRMPQSNRRAIDVTLNAAKKLNFVREGLATVTIEVIASNSPKIKK
jgi:rare lipoprotein A